LWTDSYRIECVQITTLEGQTLAKLSADRVAWEDPPGLRLLKLARNVTFFRTKMNLPDGGHLREARPDDGRPLSGRACDGLLPKHLLSLSDKLKQRPDAGIDSPATGIRAML
jgi:hypothetical protein